MGESVQARPTWLAQMEDIFETLNQGVLIIDPDGAIIFANEVFAQMIGVPADDLFGRGASDFYCGADLEFLEQKRQSGRQSDRYEFHLPRTVGRPLPVVISARKVASPDGMPFTVITFTDISEQKQHERELRHANKRLEANNTQLNTELALAARVQQSLVPQGLKWGLAATVETYYEPVHTIGGDFGLVAPKDDTHLDLLVCDVSGHGIGSALIANRIYTETVAILERHTHLGSMLSRLNRLVLDHIQLDGFFFTMAAARLDIKRRLTYAGAGHPPGLFVTPSGECRMLDSRSGLLGCMDDAVSQHTVEEVQMAAGDRLLLCTDGLTEVFNANGDMLGSDGLMSITHSHSRKPLEEMKRAILADVAAWRHGPVTDDMSLVLMEVN
jgi:sigma-B regulation protein RsbU (phosphoserine phosphatase)